MTGALARRADSTAKKQAAPSGALQRAVLTIPGRLPGLNDYITAENKSRYAGAKLKSEAQHWVILCCKRYLRGVRFRRPTHMVYTWIEPNRKRDKSNVSAYGRKIIEDALVVSGVLRDDGWDEIEGFEDRFALDRKNPRIIVEIEEVENVGEDA